MSSLEISDLTIKINEKIIVKDIGFSVAQGQTVALIGPSGCGKTLTALSVMGLLPDSSEVSGSIKLAGRQLLALRDEEMQQIRGVKIAYTMQNSNALNPSLKIKRQIKERHINISKEQMISLLSSVGLSSQVLNYYPHQLSGGMRQRVLLAIALAANPSFLIADEPTNGLDTTIARQVMRLLKDLQVKNNLGLLLITHDLAAVKQVADQVITI